MNFKSLLDISQRHDLVDQRHQTLQWVRRAPLQNLSAACGFKNNQSDGNSPQGRVSEHVKNTGLSTRVPSGSVSQPFLGGASRLLCVDAVVRRQSGSLMV